MIKNQPRVNTDSHGLVDSRTSTTSLLARSVDWSIHLAPELYA
jgi:hypothetical protein